MKQQLLLLILAAGVQMDAEPRRALSLAQASRLQVQLTRQPASPTAGAPFGLELSLPQKGLVSGSRGSLQVRIWNHGAEPVEAFALLTSRVNGDDWELQAPFPVQIPPQTDQVVALSGFDAPEVTAPARLEWAAGLTDGERLIADPSSARATVYPRSLLETPKGVHRVGVSTFHLRTTRPEEYTPTPSDVRELPLRIFYPAADEPGRPAGYIAPEAAEAVFGEVGQIASGVVPHGTAGAQAAPGGPWPLLVFSPGYGSVPELYSSLLEDLASRGHLIVAINHPYFSSGFSAFADGRTARADDSRLASLDELEKGMNVLIADVRSVLDWLPSSPWAAQVDWTRAAAFGHSMGGALAINAAAADRRLAAGINLDGTQFGPATSTGSPKPSLFLLFGRNPEEDDSLRAFRPLPSARLAMLPGAGHLAVNDVNLLAYLRAPLVRLASIGEVGALEPSYSLQIISNFVAAYLDQVLNGAPRDTQNPAPIVVLP